MPAGRDGAHPGAGQFRLAGRTFLLRGFSPAEERPPEEAGIAEQGDAHDCTVRIAAPPHQMP